MQKTITYTIDRVIDTVNIDEALVAYSDKHYRNEELIEETQGIALRESIENIQLDEAIEPYKAKVRDGVECPIALFKKEIKEVARTILFGTDKSIKAYKEQCIKKPYTYIKEFGLNEQTCLMYLSYYDHNLYDEHFVVQPKAIHFDYMLADMNNACYDLKEALGILAKRNDIHWVTDRFQDEKGPAIKSIPHYNREEGRDKFIEFIWHPTEEDFEKVRDTITNTHGRYDPICKKVFGLTKLKHN